jgi:hypothetical protein
MSRIGYGWQGGNNGLVLEQKIAMLWTRVGWTEIKRI